MYCVIRGACLGMACVRVRLPLGGVVIDYVYGMYVVASGSVELWESCACVVASAMLQV